MVQDGDIMTSYSTFSMALTSTKQRQEIGNRSKKNENDWVTVKFKLPSFSGFPSTLIFDLRKG